MSLPGADSSKMIRRIRQHHQNHHQFNRSKNSVGASAMGPSSSSRRMEHSISTPNLGLTALTSSLATVASGDTLMIERCLRCGLPDLSVITATAVQTQKNGETSAMATSLSLPSLSSLDPATIAAAMANSSFSDSTGIQGERPSMRRLKYQRRNKAIITRKHNSK